MIQKIFRGFTCRLKIRKLQESQMVIATCWKKWKDKSHISEIKQRRHEEWATLIVQKCFKGWQVSFINILVEARAGKSKVVGCSATATIGERTREELCPCTRG